MLPLRNLLRRKLRSLFALLQIAVAIAAFVSIVGVTQGLRGQFYKLSRVFAFNLIVQPEAAASPIFSVVTRQEAAAIEAVEGVKAVSLLGIHFMFSPDSVQPIGLIAIDPDTELMSLYPVVRGRRLRQGDTNQILIGPVMATDLGIDVSALLPDGKGIQGDPPLLKLMGDQTFEVVGLFETPLKEVPFLGGQAIMPLSYYEKKYGLQPRLAIAHLEPGRRAKTPDEVREGLTRCEAVAPSVARAVPRLKARTIEDFLDSFKQAELVDQFAKAIFALAALVSCIGVANTMLMSVFDRTKEIGLLRAIGWSRWRIVYMIQSEGLILSIVGGVLGLPLGVFLIWLSGLLIKMGWLNVSLDAGIYFQAVGAACLIGLLGSLYPAVRAAHLQPTEALRYE